MQGAVHRNIRYLGFIFRGTTSNVSWVCFCFSAVCNRLKATIRMKNGKLRMKEEKGTLNIERKKLNDILNF